MGTKYIYIYIYKSWCIYFLIYCLFIQSLLYISYHAHEIYCNDRKNYKRKI